MIGLNQETFNTVWNGLKAQGWQRAGVQTAGYEYDDMLFECRYRDREGRKCAVGHLIPNNAYFRGIEGSTAIDALDTCGVPFDDSTESINFLCEMQNAHDIDDAVARKPMRERFIDLARRFGLKVPE